MSVYLPSAVMVSAQSFNVAFLSAGSYSNVYQCPVQTPAIRCGVVSVFFYFTTANQSCNVGMTDGNGSWLLTNVASTNQYGGFGVLPGFILEGGEYLSTNCLSANYNVQAQVVNFDANSPLKTVVAETFAVGANTVYTAPVGKHAFFEYGLGFGPSTGTGSANGFPYGQFVIGNQSGGAVSYIPYAIPSGQAVNSKYALATTGATSVSNNFIQQFKCPVVLSPGDFISINSTAETAGQFWYATIIEQ